MKSETLTSLKFKRLCKVLALPKAYVVGLLEMLWQSGYVAGSEVIGDDIDVETACEWEGEPGALAKGLESEGWIERDEAGVLSIHDFWDHAPQYVQRKRNKSKQMRSKRAAVERANKSRENRKASQNKEVTGEAGEDKNELANGQPLASQELAYQTHQTINNNGAKTNEVEDAFGQAGIELDPPPGLQPEPFVPRAKTRGDDVVSELLQGSAEKYHLPTPVRDELAELCDAEGNEPAFREAMQAALSATPRRRGKAFVSYVSQTLGTLAADRDTKRRKPKPADPKTHRVDGAAKPAMPGIATIDRILAKRGGGK